MFTRTDTNGELLPHVTFSRARLNAQGPNGGFFAIEAVAWDGTGWASTMIREDLLDPPNAVAAWRTSPVNGNGQIVYTYNDFGTLKWRLHDTVTGLLSPEESWVHPSLGHTAALAIRQDDEPAVAWFTQVPGQPATVTYGRWDSGIPGITDIAPIPQCTGDFPSLVLGPQDLFRVTCRQDQGAFHFDVKYIEQVAAGANVVETVFGANDDDQWTIPAMTFFGGQPAVVAHNADTGQTVFRRRVATGWLPPRVIADGLAPEHLSIDAHESSQGDDLLAISILTASEVLYTEVHPNGAFDDLTPLRRVDLNGQDADGSCQFHKDAARVLVPQGGQALIAWVSEPLDQFPGHDQLDIARFTQFRRTDTPAWVDASDVVADTTSLALTDNGTEWTCYFDESAVNPPQIDLMLKVVGNPPVVAAANTGMPPNIDARGCDVAAIPGGGPLDIGVLWADSASDELRFRQAQGIGFGPAETLGDGLGDVEATGHLGLAFDANGRAHAIFRRFTTENNPWHGVRTANGWVLQQIDVFEGGSYPDITVRDGTLVPLTSYALDEAGGMMTHAREKPAGGWEFTDFLTQTTCVDTSIDARLLGGQEIVAVGWSNVTNGHVEVGRGNGVIETIDDSLGTNASVSVEIDHRGEVGVSYFKKTGVGKTLRWSAVRPFDGGTSGLLPPAEKRSFCDIREVEHQGTDLAFDPHDNPRIVHRDEAAGPPVQHSLRFLTRP